MNITLNLMLTRLFRTILAGLFCAAAVQDDPGRLVLCGRRLSTRIFG
jgi:hypothetical protein